MRGWKGREKGRAEAATEAEYHEEVREMVGLMLRSGHEEEEEREWVDAVEDAAALMLPDLPTSAAVVCSSSILD